MLTERRNLYYNYIRIRQCLDPRLLGKISPSKRFFFIRNFISIKENFVGTDVYSHERIQCATKVVRLKMLIVGV